MPDDWWGQFHLHAFFDLSEADRLVERRELVWVKRFLEHQGREDLLPRLEALAGREYDHRAALRPLLPVAAERLTTPEKRQFVYNLAQMCKAKGALNREDYNRILDLAQRLGVADTEADSIVTSVFGINETFTAIIGVLALGFILYATAAVIVPLVIALFLSMIVNLVEGKVSRALRLGRARVVSKLAAMVLIVCVVVGLVLAAVSSGRDMAQRFPFYQQKISSALMQIEAMAAQRGLPTLSASDLLEQLSKLPIGSTVGSFFSSLLGLVGNTFLVLIFTAFLVFSGSDYRGILQEMNETISAYITIKTFVSLVTGLGVLLLCGSFGVDFGLFWSLCAFLLNFIPSVGSIIATGPPILVALVQLDSTGSALAFAGLFVVFQLFLGQVLEPKLMGDRLAVKPLAIMMGLIFWGFLWGLPGMFLAAPLMAFLRILSSYFNFSRTFERLLAANP